MGVQNPNVGEQGPWKERITDSIAKLIHQSTSKFKRGVEQMSSEFDQTIEFGLDELQRILPAESISRLLLIVTEGLGVWD